MPSLLQGLEFASKVSGTSSPGQHLRFMGRSGVPAAFQHGPGYNTSSYPTRSVFCFCYLADETFTNGSPSPKAQQTWISGEVEGLAKAG